MLTQEAVAAPAVENKCTERGPVNLVTVVIGLLTFLLGGSVVAAFLLDWLGLPINTGTVGLSLAILAGLFGLLIWRGGHTFSWQNLNWAGLIGLIMVCGGVLAYGLWLGRPYGLPVDVSVDGVHQYGLADYILKNAHLPIHDPASRPNLLEGLEYPPGFVILVALIAGLLHADPVYVIYPVVVGLVALTAGVCFACLDLLLAKQPWRWLVAALASGFLLLPYDYTFGIFTFQSYFAQVSGQLFLMLSLYFALLWSRQRQSSERPPVIATTRVIAGLIISLGTLLVTYPTFVLIGLAGFGLTILTSPLSLTGWRERLHDLALVGGLVGGLAVLFFAPRVSTGLAILANEGSVLSPDLALYGWPVLVLALVGWPLAVAGWSGKSGSRAVAWFSLVFVLEGVGLCWLKLSFNQGSFYAIYKLFYSAVYLLPLLAGLGLDGLITLGGQFQLLKQRATNRPNSAKWGHLTKIFVGLALFGLLLGNTWLSHPQVERPFSLLTPDKISVAHWMTVNLQIKPGEVAYGVQSGLTAYWLEVGLLKQARNDHSDALLHQAKPLTFEEWFQTPDSPTYFLTENAVNLPPDDRYKVLYQSGPVALLTRTPLYTQQRQSVPTVAVDYTASLQGNQLSLRTEVSTSEEPSHWLQVGLRIVSPDRQQVFYQAAVPVAADRVDRRQYLGISLKLPQLAVTEFYANTAYPPAPPAKAALVPGSYAIELMLQKSGQPVQYQPLMNVEYATPDHISTDQPANTVKGRLSFEGQAGSTLAVLPQPLTFAIGSDQIRLIGWSPATGPGQALTVGAGSSFSLKTQWRIARPLTANYALRWTWLDQAGNRQFETEAVPSQEHYPTWLWPSNGPVSSVEQLTAPDQPGVYTLQLSVVDNTNYNQSEGFTVANKVVVQ